MPCSLPPYPSPHFFTCNLLKGAVSLTVFISLCTPQPGLASSPTKLSKQVSEVINMVKVNEQRGLSLHLTFLSKSPDMDRMNHSLQLM